jgi:hypothetical protein
MAMVPLREWRTPTLTVSAAEAEIKEVASAATGNSFLNNDRDVFFMRDASPYLLCD